jgi:uncharacterized protein YraI
MRRFSFLRVIASALLAALIVGMASAQATCDLPMLIAACAESPIGEACAADGESVPLDEALNADQPQILRLSDSLTVMLVGAALTAYEQSEIAVTVEIGNRAGYNVNLRGGPGSNFDQVGIFRFDERLNADGQSADGAWLRVQLADGGAAWVSASLVTLDPALAALPVVDVNATGALGYSLTLEAAESDCGAAGAFVSADGDATQRLTINELPIAMTDGAIYVGVTDAAITVYALAGDSSIGVGANALPLSAGEVSGWTGDAGAQTLDVYAPFPSLGTLDALTITPDACLIAANAANVPTYAEADAAADQGAALDAGGSYPVSEQADGAWYHLSDDFGGLWVAADDVMTLGACGDLADANATPVPQAAFGAGLSPAEIMFNYLSARVVGDAAQMQALACAAWDANALMQSQSFRAMRAQLNNVTCTTVSQSGSSAVVHCDGTIQTEYNGELRQWELGDYAMTQEGGAWRMCGEAG